MNELEHMSHLFEDETPVQSYTNFFDDPKPKEETKFDKARVAKEINDFFQKATVENIDMFDSTIQVKIVEHVKAAQTKLSQIIVANLDLIKQEIVNNRTVINLSPTRSISLDAMDHPVMKKVIAGLHVFKKAMLVGPAGKIA